MRYQNEMLEEKNKKEANMIINLAHSDKKFLKITINIMLMF